MNSSLDTFKCKKIITVGQKKYTYFSLTEAEKNGLKGISKLPFTLKILLENLLRFEDNRSVHVDDIHAFSTWSYDRGSSGIQIAYRPARVLMQDFTGLPVLVDLAAMRDAACNLLGSSSVINPQIPVDLVIDHSISVDSFGEVGAFTKNVEQEYKRNRERYSFLKWGQKAFDNLRVVPPGKGICHQINLEYLARTVWTLDVDGETLAYPDTVVGTDSHTTMINGLSVLGWGVGGIEAEAAMLGQPITMLLPEVIGFQLNGQLTEGVTATDLGLTIVQILRDKGVVSKFVEFFGSGLNNLSLEDQATISNMAPEYGATCAFFPIDKDTINYLRFTGRDHQQIQLVEFYAKKQGLWRDHKTVDPVFTDILSLDLRNVVPVVSGPKRPQDLIKLTSAKVAFSGVMKSEFGIFKPAKRVSVENRNHDLGNGDVVIAAITSCTNTSNPSVLIAAGLVARKALAKGLSVKPWVKTSLAPGSQVVTDYLNKANLQRDLDGLGFHLVGYGCTTCIGNSGPLAKEISQTIHYNDLVVCSVLSGNRNFEGRISPDVRANYLASPPLVVAYAIAGSLYVDLTQDSLGQDYNGCSVYLRDIWPSSKEITAIIRKNIDESMFKSRYKDVFKGDQQWRAIDARKSDTYSWDSTSTYIKKPPYFQGMSTEFGKVTDIKNARVLALFNDSITTDHISPAGRILGDSPAATYLVSHQVPPMEFNSYGSRRGHHDVMVRGTFSNIRIRNRMLDNVEGGYSIHYPSGKLGTIYDIAMRYQNEKVPLVIFSGKEYGTGSSRDWAAKGTYLLGIRAVIAESFERIHRSNLVGMGVLPLIFTNGDSWVSLGFSGKERVTLSGLSDLSPRQEINAQIQFDHGEKKTITLLSCIDTKDELDYFHNGGILHYVLRHLKFSTCNSNV
ncbi:aconitate hydratase AcnA [Candidatus Endowatersipora endosymbiont of Watersipora subatra]|uniref:aconitate hydratase AcnA n=1 Tax=Candidatus Endowatersipora endosymbiont of Watersipora subatra TaxID=3077946 RepID=UPI00312C99C8